MRPRRWYHPLAFLPAIWLALVLAGPGGVYRCLQHDLAAGRGTSVPVLAVVATTAHEDHGARTGSPFETAPAPQHEHGGTACLCLGACLAGGLAAFIPATPALAVAPAVSSSGTAPAEIVPLPRQARAHLLPFANGPPTALSLV